MREIADLPLALPDKNFGARQAFEEQFAREKLELDPVFVTGSLEMLKELVLREAAVTFLPALTVQREVELGLLAAVPIAGARACTQPSNSASHQIANYPLQLPGLLILSRPSCRAQRLRRLAERKTPCSDFGYTEHTKFAIVCAVMK